MNVVQFPRYRLDWSWYIIGACVVGYIIACVVTFVAWLV
jgi:hypothetical protein